MRNKAFKIVINPKYDGYQKGLASMDNVWSIDLADMQSLSKYNKEIKYLLCAVDLFSKYAWLVPIKDKKGISIVNAFQKIISKGRKPNMGWSM